eukprot:TRINITY_DN30404_c0_g1_i1.p1 TRINITY_DN30404_c0_g1~~TRINITY_DN30404_c0_g1_i1.p1  ORF type:complete len:376 (-),score=69.30 TRINITY_DN30404_c0_g1_i1:103-1230(-)
MGQTESSHGVGPPAVASQRSEGQKFSQKSSNAKKACCMSKYTVQDGEGQDAAEEDWKRSARASPLHRNERSSGSRSNRQVDAQDTPDAKPELVARNATFQDSPGFKDSEGDFVDFLPKTLSRDSQPQSRLRSRDAADDSSPKTSQSMRSFRQGIELRHSSASAFSVPHDVGTRSDEKKTFNKDRLSFLKGRDVTMRCLDSPDEGMRAAPQEDRTFTLEEGDSRFRKVSMIPMRLPAVEDSESDSRGLNRAVGKASSFEVAGQGTHGLPSNSFCGLDEVSWILRDFPFAWSDCMDFTVPLEILRVGTRIPGTRCWGPMTWADMVDEMRTSPQVSQLWQEQSQQQSSSFTRSAAKKSPRFREWSTDSAPEGVQEDHV